MAAGAEPFRSYARHYARLGNQPPNWDDAEANPAKYTCRKPWLPLNTDAAILDFGCGWGHQLLALWCAGYRNVTGVELDREQAEVARDLAGGRVRVLCVDGITFLGERRNQYDLITLNDVIEHFPPDRTVPVLECVCGALRPGGRVVVRTPNMSSLLAAFSRYLDATHLAGFTEFSLAQCLDLAGFENPHLLPDPSGWQPRAWRPWTPLRGLAIRGLLNAVAHRLLYAARSQWPRPTRYDYNLEAYADKKCP